jgi:hypothetical protein
VLACVPPCCCCSPCRLVPPPPPPPPPPALHSAHAPQHTAERSRRRLLAAAPPAAAHHLKLIHPPLRPLPHHPKLIHVALRPLPRHCPRPCLDRSQRARGSCCSPSHLAPAPLHPHCGRSCFSPSSGRQNLCARLPPVGVRLHAAVASPHRRWRRFLCPLFLLPLPPTPNRLSPHLFSHLAQGSPSFQHLLVFCHANHPSLGLRPLHASCCPHGLLCSLHHPSQSVRSQLSGRVANLNRLRSLQVPQEDRSW